MKTLLQIIIVLLMSAHVQAQQKTISGTVTSASDGLPLPGVNVIIKGSTIGVQTNFDGKYTISANQGDILSFSFIGFITKEVTVGQSNVIDVLLEDDASTLDEVVVVAYSTSKKMTYTGSVSAVTESSSRKRKRGQKLSNALSGQVAGVQISNSSGQPNNPSTIRIRGIGSVNSNNSPLYIVDGVPVSEAVFSAIDTKSIRNVEVLKDASATALYGSRGSNGIVLITTKQGNFKAPKHEMPNNESYEEIVENQFEHVSLSPLSTFSIDVDKASYSNVRRMINNGQKVPADAVKIEEMINYFNYDYPQPKDDHPFSINTEVAITPWNTDTKIVKIGIQGKTYENESLPPSNLTFLIDVSGSMSDHNKLPLLKSAFKLLINQLREKDNIAIVVYAGAAGVVLPPTSGAHKEKIISALDNLNAGGSTAGGEGIELAYKIAQKNYIKEGNNRVISICTGKESSCCIGYEGCHSRRYA